MQIEEIVRSLMVLCWVRTKMTEEIDCSGLKMEAGTGVVYSMVGLIEKAAGTGNWDYFGRVVAGIGIDFE